MPFETKSTFDDKQQYFKNLVVINTSAILIIVWVIVCGWFPSFYCVVSGANMINECLEKVPLHDAVKTNVDPEKAPLNQVPWHHVFNTIGKDGKPTQLESCVQFGDADKNAFSNTFFKKRADQYVKDVKEGADSFFFSKMWVQGASVFPRLVTHDLWFISEWHAFFQKITEKIGWGALLMTSFIWFPIFMVVFAGFNACAALWSWGESIIALYNQLNLPKEVKDAVETTDKDIDCSVQTIVKNLIILFFYVFIVPLIGLLTIAPTLGWIAMSLLIAPVYALYLPSNIQGKIVPMVNPENEKDPKLTKMFFMFNLVFSNIYSFAGGYLVFFSIVYSIIAGLKQDVYAFIGCIIAVLIIFGGLKWYKSAAPDIEVPETGSLQQNDTPTQVVEDNTTPIAAPSGMGGGGAPRRKNKSLKTR